MDEMILKFRIWARAELTLAKINRRQAGQRLTAMVVALGLILLTIVLINIGAYALLAQAYGQAKAAFLLAAANGLLAALIVIVAQRSKPGPEEELVREIREMALAELQSDADDIKAGFSQLTGQVRRIEGAVSSLTGAGSGLSKLSSAGPVIELAVQALKHRRGK